MEDLLYQDIKALKRYTTRDMSHIFFTVCPNMTTLNEISGIIISPFYPRNYFNNQSCSWDFRARIKENEVVFTIKDMDFSL